MSNDKELELAVPEPVLESPPSPEASCSSVAGSLIPEESLAGVSAKLASLEALINIVTRDYNFQDFMREVLLIVMKTVKSEAGSILELDYAKNCLFFRAVVGQSSDRVARFLIPVGQGVVGYVAESRQPLVVNNVEENRVYLKSVQNVVGFEARNLIAVPLIVRGKVFGVLELLNRVGEDNFTATDLDLLAHLSGSVSKVVEVRLMLGWASQADKSTGDRGAA